MQQIPILTITRIAGAAIAAHRFVGLNDQLCGAGAVAWGVSDAEASAAGKAVAVKVLGTSKVQVGAAVAAGQLVKADANGMAIPQAGAGAILARVLVGQAIVNGYAEVLLLPSLSAA